MLRRVDHGLTYRANFAARGILISRAVAGSSAPSPTGINLMNSCSPTIVLCAGRVFILLAGPVEAVIVLFNDIALAVGRGIVAGSRLIPILAEFLFTWHLQLHLHHSVGPRQCLSRSLCGCRPIFDAP